MKFRADTKAEEKKSRLDLSMAQVAGSAIAAVVAALLAGKLGVYGTVLGAGIVSVVASTGGSVFQHFFKRTGEQIRDVTEQAKPKARQVPVDDADDDHTLAGHAGSAADPTMALPRLGAPPTAEAEEEDRTRLLEQIEATQMLPRADPAAAGDGAHGSSSSSPFDATTMLPQVRESTSSADATELMPHAHGRSGHPADGHDPADGPPDAYTHGTTHGTRLRGWKRSMLAALAVFVLAMGTITVIELVTGSTASGAGGTTVGRIVGGGNGGSGGGDDGRQPEAPAPSPSSSSSGSGHDSGGAPDGRQSPDPSHSKSGGSDAPSKPGDDTGGTAGPSGGSTPSGSGSSSGGASDGSSGNGGTDDGGTGDGGQDDGGRDSGGDSGPGTGNQQHRSESEDGSGS
ncbi:hypothetical protein [Streptomyces sp. NPDC047108]|uniref:hypothetical protein n=1 Tax=Streptomyces sp. NPDC047108 TaxID=3155025 RepID=UPI0033DA11F2